MTRTLDLRESVGLQEGGKLRVDREAGVIHGVKVCGLKSKHGYSYAAGALDPKLYEGQRVCLNHAKPGAGRSVLDTRAWIEGVERRADGVYAERLCFAHPGGDDEQRLMGLAEKAPHLLALSHSAKAGRWSADGKVVESVASVESVDIVERGATNATLYEGDPRMKRRIRDLIESLRATRPGYARGLREQAEAGVMDPGMEMEEPPPMEEPSEAAGHEQALLDAAKQILDDTSLSSADKLNKIKAILKIVDGGGPGGGDAPAADTEEGWCGVPATLREAHFRLVTRDRVRRAAGKAGVSVPDALLESLRPNLSEKDAEALVAGLGKGRAAGPRSAPPLAGAGAGRNGASVQEGARVPADRSAWKSWLNEKGGN